MKTADKESMLWLYLLGTVTVLVIVLRRVLHRQMPLSDEVYSSRVALDHVRSSVAWVESGGTIAFVNPFLTETMGEPGKKLVGRQWTTLFPQKEQWHVREAYSQSLLQGKVFLDTLLERQDGSIAQINMLLVAIHDHKSRFMGHYCLIEDRSRIFELEEKVRVLQADPASTANR